MKKLTLAIVLCLIASSAFGAVIDKIGTDVKLTTATAVSTSTDRDDWFYNTGGVEGFVPTAQGSAAGWGEWFITSVLNDSGADLYLSELGFPCSGPATEAYGWVIWLDAGGLVAPAGDAYTADFYGSLAQLKRIP